MSAGDSDLLAEGVTPSEPPDGRTAELIRANEELRREVAERQQAEAETLALLGLIKRAKQEWEATADSLGQFVCLLDNQGRVLRANRTLEDWGLGKVTDVGGLSLHEVLHPDSSDPDCYLAAFLARARERLILQVSTETEVWDPELERWLSLCVNPISRDTRQDNLSAGGWAVVIIEDISERVQVREELHESNRRLEKALTELRATQEQIVLQERLAAVGQLAAGISHDFNNTMASIILFADVMLRSSRLTDKDRERLTAIRRQGRHAADLTQQILDFGRKAMLKRCDLDLMPFLRDLETLLSRTLPENIGVHLQGPDKEVVINVDPTRLQQAIMNLAINARDAMPDGGNLALHVATELRDDARWVRLEIRDTGCGIPTAVLPHVFEPFFSTKGVGEGTGLGLSQVYGIVTQHGGLIDVSSQPGRGTEFRLFFPAQAVAAPLPCVQPVVGRGQGERILVVEDDPIVRDAIEDGLSLMDYRPVVAANGREALEVLGQQAERISLVLTDLVMPEMGGAALCEALSTGYPQIPVVILTGYSQTTEDLSAVGALASLQKPVEMAELAQTIGEILKKKSPQG